MDQRPVSESRERRAPGAAALVRTSGPLAGARYLLRGPLTRVGRGPKNDVVIQGPDAAVVSAHHLEIRREGGAYRLSDLNSTNGTWVDGERVSDVALRGPCSIRLGPNGPELSFLVDDAPAPDLNQTLVAPPAAAQAPPPASGDGQPTEIPAGDDQMLLEAVHRARLARRVGVGNQTVVIMREVLQTVLRRTGRRFRWTVAVLVALLIAVSGYGWWRVRDLKLAKRSIDEQIRQLETRLPQLDNPSDADRLIAALDQYQGQAQALQRNLLYRLGVWERDDFVQREVKMLLAEFGAEVYSIPPEFLAQVQRHLGQYQGPDRPHMQRALGEARPVIEQMLRIFGENNLPSALAYMALVESALDSRDRSEAGAAGLWQFTPATARAYGLRVSDGVDERLDYAKATRAASKYVRELILDFGTGSSVMLALAAYNVGPSRVKQAIRNVEDPIKQRNFWYLYRARALPLETREYVPKVFAAMIIGRNPERFGF